MTKPILNIDLFKNERIVSDTPWREAKPDGSHANPTILIACLFAAIAIVTAYGFATLA